MHSSARLLHKLTRRRNDEANRAVPLPLISTIRHLVIHVPQHRQHKAKRFARAGGGHGDAVAAGHDDGQRLRLHRQWLPVLVLP